MEQIKEIIGNIILHLPKHNVKDIALTSIYLPPIILQYYIFNPKIVKKPGISGCINICHSAITIPLFDNIMQNNRPNVINLFKNIHQKQYILNFCLLKKAHIRALKILKSNNDLANNKTMYYAAKNNQKDIISFLFTLKRFKNNKIKNIVLHISVSNGYSNIVKIVLESNYINLENVLKDFLFIAIINKYKKIEELIVNFYIKKCPKMLVDSINKKIPSLYALEQGYVHITNKNYIPFVISSLIKNNSQNDILKYLKNIIEKGLFIKKETKKETIDLHGNVYSFNMLNIISKENLEYQIYKPCHNTLYISITSFKYKIIDFLLKLKVSYNGFGLNDIIGQLIVPISNKIIKKITKCIKVLLKDKRTNLKDGDYYVIRFLIHFNLIDIVELIVRNDRFTNKDMTSLLKSGPILRTFNVNVSKDIFINSLKNISKIKNFGKIIKKRFINKYYK